MGMDMVTYLRTEWVSAALCTNQIPRAADTCLQLGVEDGRAVTFIPRTIRELITSSAEADGKVSVSARRQLKQQQERRGAARIKYVDQRADDLKEMADESLDVVISITAAARMNENGLDWKRSVREAARVLKPGGRLLFVEQRDLTNGSYLDYVENLVDIKDDSKNVLGTKDDDEKRFPIFDVGWDSIDLVLNPHIAGVAIKSLEAGLTAKERAQKEKDVEKDRIAELSIKAFERGIKKRRKKKKKDKKSEDSE